MESNKDNNEELIEQLCKEFLPNAFELASFRPKEVIRLEMAFIQGANVMMNHIKNSPPIKDNVSDGWISTKDGLPESMEDVLCFTTYKRIVVNNYCCFTDQEEQWFKERFAYWKKLPSPPKQ